VGAHLPGLPARARRLTYKSTRLPAAGTTETTKRGRTLSVPTAVDGVGRAVGDLLLIAARMAADQDHRATRYPTGADLMATEGPSETSRA
jgi:hypothetical protein